MSDDERKHTDQLRSVEIDALLRSEQDDPQEVASSDATKQIRPADLSRLEQVVAAKGIPTTEKIEAVGDKPLPHATERMEYVRPTQQSGHLRAVLDQDLREVPVEPLNPEDVDELDGPTNRLDAIKEPATTPLPQVHPQPQPVDFDAPEPAAHPPDAASSGGAGVVVILALAATLVGAAIAVAILFV